MSLWIQHLLVIVVVATCCGLMLRQAVSTFRGGSSGFGSCCAKGCSASSVSKKNIAPVANTRPEKIVFIPVEMLKRRK